MIARSELEAEVSMLRRELASIAASANRSRDLAARLEDESHELKSRIESAKYEEEQDRKRAEELEEELAELADEVNGQLDELERVNGTGSGSAGIGKAVGKALLRSASASFGDAASVGGRSRASSAGGSLVDEVQSRFEDACSVGEGMLDNTFTDEVSVRSRGIRDGTTIQVRQSRHGSSGRSSSNTRHPSTGRPASELQQQWEAAYNNTAADAERPTRSTSWGSTGYESGDRARRFADQSRREEELGGLAATRSRSSGRTTRSHISSLSASDHSSPRRGAGGRESDVERRRETYRDIAEDGGDMNDSWRARQESLTKSFHSLFKSLGQEVDRD